MRWIDHANNAAAFVRLFAHLRYWGRLVLWYNGAVEVGMRVLMALLAVVVATTTPAQNAPPTESAPDALRILSQVAQKYAEAKSYHIEATEELIRSNE